MHYFPNKPIRVYNPQKVLPSLGDLASWVVQPKWDGKRAGISCSSEGFVSLASREGNPWPKETGWGWLAGLDLPKPWFLDGELLRDGRLFVWDYPLLGGEKVFRSPYQTRLERLQVALPSPIERQGKTLECIETLPASASKDLLQLEAKPSLEGVVWKRKNAKDFWGPYSTSEVGSQFKYRF